MKSKKPQTKKISRKQISSKKFSSRRALIFAMVFALVGSIALYVANAQSTSFYGKLWNKNTSDTYRVDVKAAGNIKATLSVVAKSGEQSARLKLTLKDKFGVVLTEATAHNYNDSVSVDKRVDPGPYYLEVTSRTNLSSKGISFLVSVQSPDAADTLVPIVTINNSDQLANVSGTIKVNGSSSDASGIKITRMIINGSIKASVTTGNNWEFNLDTKTYSDGVYQLVIESEDNAGNKGKSGVSMAIDNSPPEDSTPTPPAEDPTVPPTPTPTPDTSSFLNGSLMEANYSTSNIGGWTYEESGASEKLLTVGDHVECYAGGYAASTHYARVRRKMPERDNFAARKRFSIESTFELPSNYYTQHESYMRLITTDNYPAPLSGTGATVGASGSDEWRVGFTIYGGDGLFRLISEKENQGSITLWKASTKLPVGKHTVKINFAPSKTATGAWEIYIDGTKAGSGSNVQTVPSTVADSEIAVTRIGGCIDGAANQDTKVIQANLYSIIFKAER
jgi:hypothetical protein